MRTSLMLFTLFVLVAFIAFGFSARRLLKLLQVGKPEHRFDRIGVRLKKMLAIAFAQTKLLREPAAGVMHLAIFWGFVVLLAAVVESLGEGLAGSFSLRFLGPLYPVLTFSQEVFCLLVVAAVVVALWRRFVARIKRLQVDRHGRFDAVLILVWIFLIVGTLLLENAARISLGRYQAGAAYPVSSMLFPLLGGSAGPVEPIVWWAHIALVLGFLNYLPYSKHLHVLTSVPNVFLTEIGPRGALKTIDFTDEQATKFGASDIEDLTWKQLLDGYTCTECGRCDSVCPANLTGKPLSPRKIIVETRRRTLEKGPVLLAETPAAGPMPETFVGDRLTEEELWACTSCMACVYECPVTIEHVREIVDLRRGLVLNESKFPPELRTTFENLERNFTPWNFSHASRAEWCAGMGIPQMADVKEPVEILYWVGCAGSYDARYQKVARAFSRLMQQAGVRFAILGNEEKCTGDPARRTGNEYLASMLVTDNVATLNRYGVKKIVTTCPHCYHTLKNEYPQFGGTYEVVHHTEFLEELLDNGALKVAGSAKGKTTYHDSCYLARYNGVMGAPRELLRASTASALAEMRRSGDRTFCCGAGGGRMFMEERIGKPINIERTEEALGTGADTIGTACPFCMTMLTDGVKAKEASDRVAVRDVAEILLEAVEGGRS